ncbi:MAG: hypothetical protein FWG25_01410 [Promicromonosporaceae bacterium]|nr:hypothetical protein [Promicromonosporaceae bacterium]
MYDASPQGDAENLVLVDYKTSIGIGEPLQLQIYSEAGLREGLSVERAIIADMQSGELIDVPIGATDRVAATGMAEVVSANLRARRFPPEPSPQKCRDCDVRLLCGVVAA